jgi:RNA polymerase sigma-70 factor (ECF subfamily)
MERDGTATRDPDADRADLLASVRDPSRFGQLFERHVIALFRYFARRVGPDAAEDLAGATFAEAFANRGRYDPALASPRAWLFAIATTKVLHHRRGLARRGVAEARLTDPVEPEAATEVLIRRLDDGARLDAALSLIGPELREIVLLIAIGELSYEECATALQIPLGTVQSRLFRARQALRGLLEDPTANLLVIRSNSEGGSL